MVRARSSGEIYVHMSEYIGKVGAWRVRLAWPHLARAVALKTLGEGHGTVLLALLGLEG